MRTYRKCALCQQTDSPPNKEELMAKWVAREFPDHPWTIHSKTTGRQFKSRHDFGLTTNKICTRCNNGWMSQLENKAKPILTPMIHDTATTLDVNAQTDVAKWAMKTSVVFDIHSNRSPVFFTPDDCLRLFQAQALPDADVAIFLARYVGTSREQMQMTESRRKFAPSDPKSHDPLGINTHTMTFAIKHLAVQIFSLHRAKEFDSPLIVHAPSGWQDALVQVWPAIVDRAWPPRLALDENGFELFVHLWDAPGVSIDQ